MKNSDNIKTDVVLTEEVIEEINDELTEEVSEEPAEEAVKKKKKFRLKKNTIALISVFACFILINIVAWYSPTICDWYLLHVFPIWTQTFGRLMSIFPFSFGEILIIFALIALPLSFVTCTVLAIVLKKHRKSITKIWLKTVAWCIAYVLVTETLNCFVLYHCSSFASRNGISENEYSYEQLVEVADMLVDKCNEAEKNVKRDSEGRFVLSTDLKETAKKNLTALGEKYEELDGFYTNPKPVINSFFMSQQYLLGIYFPFTLEANYNKDMYASNLPCTVTHELVHTKGIILEDEASFIAFLACINSDDADYVYSGYLSAVKYILGKVDDNENPDEYIRLQEKLNSGVWQDIDYNQQHWDEVQEDDSGLFDSSVVADISDKAFEKSLKLNGVEDGKKSYGRMVDLLLNYYLGSEDR